MIGHLFKLVWNRRRTNALVLLELVVSFLVLCGVLTLVGDLLVNWRKPLGFRAEGLWHMTVAGDQPLLPGGADRSDLWGTFEQLRVLIRGLEEVEAFTPLAVNHPYSSSLYGSSSYFDGVRQYVRICEVLPEAKEVLGLDLVAGRWLEPSDVALTWTPVVVNRAYARALFGEGDPIGRTIRTVTEDGSEEKQKEGQEHRVVGVVASYRQRGELFPEDFVQFVPIRPGAEAFFPVDYLVRVRAGVTAAFEEELLRAVHGIAPRWTVTVAPVTQERTVSIRDNLIPLAILMIVAAFLLTMVGLGLMGVLWQSVGRRTEELGLRRALGASAGEIRLLVLGELLALTTVAVGIGAPIFLQMPLLGINEWISLRAYLIALTFALLVIYAFVALCGLYPSWLATRVAPAEALQYE